MPCYDKKLEAVRPDFTPEVKEVDTVLATHELLDLFEQKGINFAETVRAKAEESKTEGPLE